MRTTLYKDSKICFSRYIEQLDNFKPRLKKKKKSLRFVVPPEWRLHYFTHPYPFSSFDLSVLSLSFFYFVPARGTLWECDRSHSFLCCIAFVQRDRETAETCANIVGPLLYTVSEKWPPTLRFECAGHEPAVTHTSTEVAQSCLTCVTAWNWTPTTHRTLSMISSTIPYELYTKTMGMKFQKHAYIIML